MPQLIVKAEEKSPEKFSLTSDVVVIGRGETCDIRLKDDRQVSRAHCRLTLTPEGYVISDLGKNATLVNGMPVKEHLRTLQPGDVIKVGRTEIVFASEEAENLSISSGVPTSEVVEKPPQAPQEQETLVQAKEKKAPEKRMPGNNAPVETWKEWLFSRRPVYRSIQFATLALLLITVIVSDFTLYNSHEAGAYWDEWFPEHFSVARALDYYGITGGREERSSEKSVLAESGQKGTRGKGESIVKRDRLFPDKSPQQDTHPRRDTNPFDEIAQQALRALQQDVRTAIASRAWADGQDAIARYKTTFPGMNLEAIKRLEDSLSQTLAAVSEAKRRHEAEMEKLFNDAKTKADKLVVEERFEEAEEEYVPLLFNPGLRERAEKAIAGIGQVKEARVKTLPERRAALVTLFLELRPSLAKLDFKDAHEKLHRLERDPRFKDHSSVLKAEKSRLECASVDRETMVASIKSTERMGKLAFPLRDGREVWGKFDRVDGNYPMETIWLIVGEVRSPGKDPVPVPGEHGYRLSEVSGEWLVSALPEKDRDLIRVADFLLFIEEYEVAGRAAMGGFLKTGETTPEIVEFFERHQMILAGLRDHDIGEAMAKGDLKSLSNVREKYAGVEEDTQWRIGLDERIARFGVADASYRGLKPEIVTLVKKIVESVDASRMSVQDRATLADEKVKAIKSLKIVGDEKTIPYVATALSDESSQVRTAACDMIASSGTTRREIAWKIVKLLDDPVPIVGQAAVTALKTLEVGKYLIREKSGSADANDRRLAAAMAGVSGDKSHAGILTTLLTDPQWEVRKVAAISLGKLEIRNAGSALVAALKKEKSDEVEVAIAFAIGRIGYSSGVDDLGDLLKRKPNHLFKNEIVGYMGGIRSGSVATALIPYLKDVEPWTRYQAAESIARSGGKVSEKDVRHLFADDLWLTRAAATNILIVGEKDSSLDTLISVMSDDAQAAVRMTAMQGLLTWKNRSLVAAKLVQKKGALSGEGQQLAEHVLKEFEKDMHKQKGMK